MQKIFQHENVIALRDQDSVQVDALPKGCISRCSSLSRLPVATHAACTHCFNYSLLESLAATIQDMLKRLEAARRAMIVGNGGIALELV